MRLFAVAKEKVSKFPIHISDKSGLTISDISTMINIYKKKHKIGLVVIDHLGLIRSTAAARNASERAAHVGEMSKTLKSIAKREHLPILVCVQLNRETLKNENFEPQLQNLAESGDIERDADVVLMVHRPEVYQKKGYKGIGQFFVRKQRDGAIGTVHFTYPENISRIEECPIELIPQS
jgi:replicative DNA helicase